jgi:hypothetical protein
MSKKLILNIDKLSSVRNSEIKEIVKDIFPNVKRFQCKSINKSKKICYVLSDRAIRSHNIDDYNFRTHSPKLKASYYEIWNPLNKGNYYLSKAYFHLYRIDNEYLEKRNDGEYVLLHCDPNDNDEHGNYKRSPHIHIENANYPINKAHIALNLSDIEEILESRLKLNKALKNAILMLKKQIVDKLLN